MKGILISIVLLIASFARAEIPDSTIEKNKARSVRVFSMEATSTGPVENSLNATMIADGFILTAAHGVKDKPIIFWQVFGKDSAEVYRIKRKDVVCPNDKLDIAFLRVAKGKIPASEIKLGQEPKVGEKCFLISTVSYPILENFYLESYVTKIDPDGNIFTIFLPVIPGMSGSPVYNEKGELIGVLVAGINVGDRSVRITLGVAQIISIKAFRGEIEKILK